MNYQHQNTLQVSSFKLPPCTSLRIRATVPAPPAAFRDQTIIKKVVYTTGNLENTCTVIDSLQNKCSDPGYKIQWPYIETSTGVSAVSSFMTPLDMIYVFYT